MANVVYNGFKKALVLCQVDLLVDTIKVALVDESYIPDQDADIYFSDITNEVVATGYTSGGKTLSNKSIYNDLVLNRAVFFADPVTWSLSSIIARRAILYKDTGDATTSLLICCEDFGRNKLSTPVGDFTINWDITGIIRFQ